MKVLNRLEDLPSDSRVALYGAGAFGVHFKRLLETYRKDIDIVSFIDTFENGEQDGLAIATPDELEKIGNESDLILITIVWSSNVPDILRGRNIESFALVNRLFFPMHIGTKEGWLNEIYDGGTKLVKEMFQFEEDKELYESLLELRTFTPDVTERHHKIQDIYGRSKGKQYLEHINRSKVKTVLEGGVLDGRNTTQFLEFLPEEPVVFGFEPDYEAYMNGEYFMSLEEATNVEILPLALWENRHRLPFLVSERPGTSSVLRQDKGNAVSKYVDSISIDEFVVDKNIQKVDFVKLDIEGSELEVLRGGKKTLGKDRPQMAVSIYHSLEDMFEIPSYLNRTLTDYRYRLGHYSLLSDETVLYAIPKEVDLQAWSRSPVFERRFMKES